jgi:hypothetical protein
MGTPSIILPPRVSLALVWGFCQLIFLESHSQFKVGMETVQNYTEPNS